MDDSVTGEARTTLVVVFGGQSAEHDVSCSTAAHVLRAVDLEKYSVVAVGIDRHGAWHLAEAAMTALDRGPSALPERLEASGREVASAPLLSAAASTGPIVVVPLLHGPLGEDGTIQGLLELLDIPYVGTGVLGSALGMDKAMAKNVLASCAIPQPRFRSLRAHLVTPSLLSDVIDDLGLPLFVKPANMGSSVGVSKVSNREQMASAVEHALRYDEWVVCEEAIVGREIEVAVLGNLRPEASVPGEIIPGNDFYDYEDKYVTDGAHLVIPAELDSARADEVRALALRVFDVLRCEGLARVDFFYEPDGRGFLCNEVNTMPGFTPISMYPKLWQASGVAYPELIDRLVQLALERHARRRRDTAR
ncbi:MAG: D-alanine--D-alanine ligase family protein [Actinomycetota bacterium]